MAKPSKTTKPATQPLKTTNIVKYDAADGALLLLAQVGAWCMVARPGFVPFVMNAEEFHARGEPTEAGRIAAERHMANVNLNLDIHRYS